MDKRTILIVEDQQINRKLLKKILHTTYAIQEASNGREAIEILKARSKYISAILLDLVMPTMDGFELLKKLKQNSLYSEIPVIITTLADSNQNEIKALEMGARDFVAKPFNPLVLKKRLANLIELYESNNSLYKLEHDQLTGLINQDMFIKKASQRLLNNKKVEHTVLILYIENLKIIKENYDIDYVNGLVKKLAIFLNKEAELLGGLSAKLYSKHFSLFISRILTEEHIINIIKKSEEYLKKNGFNINIFLNIGVFTILDNKIEIEKALSRAIDAADTVKGQYKSVFAFYNEKMKEKALRDHIMINTANDALEQEQFLMYLQPKHSLENNNIVGMEALARWAHPELGFISPNDFIQLFEKNGFITKLDLYILKQACKTLEILKTRNQKLVPISVNLSRRDIYHTDIIEKITDITSRYDTDHSLIHFEITESANTENQQHLIAFTSKLKSLGFVLEMDDFGKEYASLDMLVQLPIDVLKLDMKFVQLIDKQFKAENMLKYVKYLADSMEITVVAEGVETIEQINVLKKLKFNYVQGYYYSKPLSLEDTYNYIK